MSEPLVIRIDELRNAITRALVAAEERLGAEVNVADDYYWHLPVDEAFDMSAEPTSLTVGQLSDDLEHLRDADTVEPVTVWHYLAHLVGLLRAVERHAMP
jgi:hypothetical protein